MADRLQIRRDTAANWAGANPILAQGEWGYELDTVRLKIGDGILNWVSLPYFAGGAAGNVLKQLFNYSGSNVFTLPQTPTDIISVSLNGVELASDGIAWTISGSNITIGYDLETDDFIQVVYTNGYVGGGAISSAGAEAIFDSRLAAQKDQTGGVAANDTSILSVDLVSDILTTPRNNRTRLYVNDLDRGGMFSYEPTGLDVDNGIVFEAEDGGYWVRNVEGSEIFLDWFTSGSGVDVSSILPLYEEWSIKNSFVVNSSTETGVLNFKKGSSLEVNAPLTVKKWSGEFNPFIVNSGGSVNQEDFDRLNRLPENIFEQETYRFPYDVSTSFAAAIGVNTFLSSEFRVTHETGRFLLYLEYTGFINQIRIQTRNATGSFLSQIFNQITGVTNATTAEKTRWTGDSYVKKIVIPFSGIMLSEIGTYRGITVSLNHNVADQDAEFSVISVKYGWENDKNVVKKKFSLPLDQKYIAMRGYRTSGEYSQYFWDSQAGLDLMILEANKYFKYLPLQGVRFPVFYKVNTTSGGDVIPQNVTYIKNFLDHLHRRGQSAIVTLNHFFQTGFTDETVQPSDIDDSTKRTNMANRAAALVSEIAFHPAVRCFELENEINLSLSASPNSDLDDYLDKLYTAVKAVTNRPLSLCLSGALAVRHWISLVTPYCDIIDIHGYGAALNDPYFLEKPLISTETDLAVGLNRQRYYTGGFICPWHAYVDPDSADFESDTIPYMWSTDSTRPVTDIGKHIGYYTHSANMNGSTPLPSGDGVVIVYSSTALRKFQRVEVGTTAQRKTGDLSSGEMYFDTTLNKPIWYTGSVWVDATGATV